MAIYILVSILAFSSGYYIGKRRTSRQPLSGGGFCCLVDRKKVLIYFWI